jgi:hypothetical protein
MKFIYIFILFLIFIPYISFSQNLTKVEGYIYQVEQNRVTSDTILSIVKWYDANNNTLVREERYWTDGQGKNIEKITYTKKGDIQKKEYRVDDSIYQSSEFERDEHNELKKQILIRKSQKKILHHKNSYDKKGRLIKSIITFANAPKEIAQYFTSYTTYNYDKEGNLSQLSQYIETERLELYIYRYDKNNNLIEEKYLNYRTNENFKTIYLYNRDNQVIKKSVYRNDEWDFTIDTIWEYGIIKIQTTYYSPYTKEEYHEVTFFKAE